MPRGRSKSPAKKRAARANGKLGGRPRDKLPAKVLADLGAPPEKPRELRVWNARVLAEVLLLNMRGEVTNELAASIRAGCGAIGRALPVERPGDPDEDDDDQDDDGPELEEVAGDGGGLRVG